MYLFVDRLTIMDFSYLDAQNGLLGETWQVNVRLQGDLDEQGMVVDFGDVKRHIKQLIDAHFDHRLLLPSQHPHFEEQNRAVVFKLPGRGRIRHYGPEQAIQRIPTQHIAPQPVAQAIETMLKPHLPPNVHQVQIQLHPESSGGAYYQYSHGLKRHCGNCQRIAHGHRSKILIWRNHKRAPQLEAQWAKRFQAIYIGNEADLHRITQYQDQSHFCFAYQAEQGYFELELPATQCYLLDSESTVENIARHIRQQLERADPNAYFQVQAYEGIDKGAISHSASCTPQRNST